MFRKKQKLSEEEQKILDEIIESEPKEDSFFKILFSKDDDEKEELDSYLTDAEKEEILNQKKEEKKMIIIMSSTMGTILFALIIFFIIFKYCIKSDLEKYVMPAAETYYTQKYGGKETVQEISYLCEEKCSKKILVKMSDGVYVMSLDGKTFVDNKDNTKMLDKAKNYLNNIATNTDNIINTNVDLNYKDYYLTYNMYMEHHGMLPDMEFSDMLKTKKLDITATILYYGEININGLKNALKTLGDNSKFYLIKKDTVSSDLNKLIIISKKEELSFDVSQGFEKLSGVKILTIDKAQNGIEEVVVSKVHPSDLTYLSQKKNAKNSYAISLDKEYVRKGEKPKPTYYMIKISNKLVDVNNMDFYTNSYGGSYTELKKSAVPEIIFSLNGEEVYIIGNSEVTFATLIKGEAKKSFWCKLGIC